MRRESVRTKRSQNYVLLAAAILTFFSATCNGQRQNTLTETLRGFIDEKEFITRRIAEVAAVLHEKRVQQVRNCECSLSTCSSNFATSPCAKFLGTPPSCTTKGRKINIDESIFRMPPGENPNKPRDSIKENICVYKGLESVFLEVWKKGEAWMYFGTRDGHFRRFPSTGDGHDLENKVDPRSCSTYDPRVRPWYIAASTGPKDVVIVVDRSFSMNELIGVGEQSKWDVVQQTTLDILRIFTVTDFVNIVMFSDDTTSLWTESGLARGTAENLDTLKKAVMKEFPTGDTNFTVAFETAFQLLANCTQEPKTCSNCQKIILFLTDGMDTTGPAGTSIKPSKLAAIVDDLQEELKSETRSRAAIFTYSMTTLADDNIPRQLACANNGAWSFIGPNTDALNALNSYYLYIADSRRSTNPIWLDPFEDFSGLGNITTVAMPVYSRGRGNVRGAFLGVAGHDVLLSKLNRGGFTEQEVLNEIIRRAEICPQQGNTACDYQVIRNSNDPRAVCTDPYPMVTPRRLSTSSNVVQVFCYEFRGSFYKRLPVQVKWNTAVSSCEDDGGQLVVIEDEEELAFVANMAQSDGSWIGANSPSGNVYSWINSSIPDIPIDSAYWGVGEPSSHFDVAHCVSIDTRGTTSNLDLRICSEEQSPICKYSSDEYCPGMSSLPAEGFFVVPPLSSCLDSVETLDETIPIPEAAELQSEDIICPVGRRNAKEDVTCCDAPNTRQLDTTSINSVLTNAGSTVQIALKLNVICFLVIVFLYFLL